MGDREAGNGFGASKAIDHALVAGLLRQVVRTAIGAEAYGADGRLRDWQSALLPDLAGTLNGLPDGLDHARLRRAEGGAVLALNSFVPWHKRSHQLAMCDLRGFDELRFHARCPAGLRGTPPRIDLIARREAEVVAVTAKGAEYLKRLAPRRPDTRRYERIEPLAAWLDLLEREDEEPGRFTHLDIPTLVKLAIGVGRTFPRHRALLLYLFWEADNAADYALFRDHRRELALLGEAVAGSGVALHFLSFAELWQAWLDDEAAEAWLVDLVAKLRERYGVAIA